MSSGNADFCFPIKRLENSRVALEPFNVAKHASSFVEGCKDHPELFNYLPYGPFSTTAEFEIFYQSRVEHNPAEALFAIFTKSPGVVEQETLAGIIGLLNASPGNASVELGFVYTILGLTSSSYPFACLTLSIDYSFTALSKNLCHQQRRRTTSIIHA